MKKKRLQYISLLLFFTYLLNLCVPCLPVQAEAISAPVSLTEDTSFSDIAGHWAEKGIKAWTTRQLAGGYPDGTFRPDSPITRAEFLTLVNRAFGYTAAGQASYCDVAETDWFAGEIAKAAAVGYLGGYPDGTVKPRNPITRQEAAALFAKILPPSETSVATETFEISATQNQTAQFADQAQIPAWSQAAIAAAVRGGYMSGYPDGTFQPTRPITRAEAISVLDRAVGTLYNHAGTYGSSQGTTLLEGNVTINTAGITLQNMTITGNIYLTEGIGEGDVTLDNVIIQGTTKISGGGSNSIHLLNTTVGAVLVNVPNRHLVRLLAQGSTAVGTLEARTPARLEEEGLTGSGFTKVVINTQQAITAPGSTTPQSSTITVELLGQFSDIEVQSATAQLNLQGGSIQNLTLTSTAQAAQINLAAWTSINTLTADTPATVQGQGTIEMLEANVDGVVVEASAKNVILEDGVQATVEGKTITENIVTETKKKKSKDAALSDLTIDGKTGKTTVPGFASDILSYEIILSEETKTAPTVAATAHYSKAKAEVTQATTLPGSATVLVIAENGATRKYIVNFVTATVCGIAVKSAPTKTCYIEGDCLDLTGLVVTLTRTDGSTEDVSFVNFDSKGISASPANGTELSPTNKEVIITHTVSGMSVGQAITVTVTSTYTVTYAGNGNTAGAVPSDSTEYEKGASVTVLGNTGNLVREDYTFAGWNTQANGEGTSYAEGATFAMGTANVTLYAQWTIKTYKVTYEGTNAGSGDVPLDGNVYEKGASVTVLGNIGNLVREDYTFTGWNTQADGKGTTYQATDTFAMGTANVTLYAQWTIKTYKVTYEGTNAGSGDVPLDGNVYEKGASVTVLGNTGNLVREDYTFAGWNTQANGEGTTYQATDTFAMGTANVTLYAQWTIKTYKVTYEGTNAGSGDVPLDGNVYEKGASVTVLGNTGNLVREDYTFAGWNTQANGEGTSYAAGAEFSITADTTLYAKWENVLVDSITVTGGEGITTDQGTLQMSAAVLPANATDKTVTWSVLTWADDGSVLTGDAIISETGVLTAVVNGTVKVVATAKDGSGVKGELEITISNQAVRSLYGVSWRTSGKDTSMTRLGTAKDKTAGTDFSDFYPWSEMKLCNVADDGKTIIYIGDKDEFGEELFKRDGTNGQVMVKIPKFYYKHTYNDTTGEHRFWATDGPAAGFALHPAFIRAGAEKDYVFIGAYEAWIDDNGKLASISGKPPTTNKKIADFRAAAQVRRTETNKGWNQLDVQTISAVQLLYLVENANTNCQTAIGKGVVDLGWTNGEYRAVVTGGCDDLGGASGMVDSGENGKKSVSYRGIENLWGNVWAFVDGININDHVPSVDGTVAGFTLSSDNGWVSNFAYSTAGDWLLMPGAVVSNESDSYVPDYYYQTPDERVALVGGYWNSGTIAGLFSWGVHRDSSNANLDVGGRVLLIP